MSSITRAVQGARKRRQMTAAGRLKAASMKSNLLATSKGPGPSQLEAGSAGWTSRKGFGGIPAAAGGGYTATGSNPGTVQSTVHPTVDKGVREQVHLAQPAQKSLSSGKSLTGKTADVVQRDQPRTGGLSDLMRNAQRRRGLARKSY